MAPERRFARVRRIAKVQAGAYYTASGPSFFNSCPHLFHAPEMPKPPIHIRDLITRDKDIIDRRAYLKEQKLLDFAKLMAPRSQNCPQVS